MIGAAVKLRGKRFAVNRDVRVDHQRDAVLRYVQRFGNAVTRRSGHHVVGRNVVDQFQRNIRNFALNRQHCARVALLGNGSLLGMIGNAVVVEHIGRIDVRKLFGNRGGSEGKHISLIGFRGARVHALAVVFRKRQAKRRQGNTVDFKRIGVH